MPHHELDRGEQGFEEPVFIWGQVGKLSDKNTTTNGFGATKQLSCQSSDSLVAQMVKNLAATQETRGRSLGWEDPLEKGKATHSGILAWRIPGESDTTERLSLSLSVLQVMRTKSEQERGGRTAGAQP